MNKKREIAIGVFGAIVGFILIVQIFSYANINFLNSRDLESNIFQEIQILKGQNEDLAAELSELEQNFEQLTNKNSVIEAIENEILKYKKLSGDYPIYGPGIEVLIQEELSVTWVVDLVNEILNAGAEAVSINGIRFTDNIFGIGSLPQGQILLNEAIIKSPVSFQAIGEPSVMQEVLESPGGIVDRLEGHFRGDVVKITVKEMIQMD